ncbi:MAG: hypothetical protein AB8E82_03860 [Aureispira sp.]
MSFKVLTILLLLIISGNCTHSYANLVYSNTPSTTNNTAPPPAKKKKAKKRKKKQKYHSAFRFKRNRTSLTTKEALNSGMSSIILGLLALLIILLIAPALFIIGGLTGGIGWFIAGSIIALIWITLGAVFGFISYGSGIIAGVAFVLGMGILLVHLLGFLSLFIWALVANLSLLLIFSIIWGGLALLGLIGIFVFIAIMTS